MSINMTAYQESVYLETMSYGWEYIGFDGNDLILGISDGESYRDKLRVMPDGSRWEVKP